MSGSRKGIRPLNFLMAFCRSKSDFNFLAFRSAARIGLSSVNNFPSCCQIQVPASPRMMPGRLLISTRKKPTGVKSRRSTSLMLPSSAMNSEFAQALYGSRSGNRERTNTKASLSQGNCDSAIVCQFADVMAPILPVLTPRQKQFFRTLEALVATLTVWRIVV